MISDRALNRTLLRRQFLLDRVERPALDVVEHLVGLQAQEPADPYLALWDRIAGFDPAELATAVASGDAVRIALQRSTIHLVSARPTARRCGRCCSPRWSGWPAPASGPGWPGSTRPSWPRRPGRLSPINRGRSASLAGHCASAGRTGPEIALAQTARALVPMVQLPPRGVWGRSGRALHGLAAGLVDEPFAADPAPDRLVLRYLAAFGPATVADVQNWSGLTRLAEVVDRLRPGLRTDRAEDGRELLDLPDAPRAEPDLPAPVRFLPQYDNVLLGHADRGRIVPAGAAALFDEEFHWSPALVDGMLRASWRLDRRAGVLHVRAAGLSRAERTAVAEEGRALLGLLAPAADPDVVISAG